MSGDNQEMMDQEDVNLNYTQGIRRDIATSLLKKGIPEDLEQLRMLVQVTDSMDRTSLGRKRITNDKKALDVALMERELIAKLMSNPAVSNMALPPRALPLAERVFEYTPTEGEMGGSNVPIEYADIYTSGGVSSGEDSANL